MNKRYKRGVGKLNSDVQGEGTGYLGERLLYAGMVGLQECFFFLEMLGTESYVYDMCRFSYTKKFNENVLKTPAWLIQVAS